MTWPKHVPGKSVLIIAQELALRAKIARTLQSAGYTVELAAAGKRALNLAANGTVDAAIVVPGSSPAGSTIIRDLRATVPRIIVLADPRDEVVRPGRSLPSADAFLLQPLDEQELLDRIGRSLASSASAGAETAPADVCFEGRTVDLAARAFLDVGGREVQLTRAESALLAAFIRTPGRVLSRDQLRRAVVGQGTEPFDRTVDVLVGRLRRRRRAIASEWNRS